MIDLSSFTTSTQGSGNAGISNFILAMDEPSNTQRTMHQQLHGLQQQHQPAGGGTEQSHQHLDGSPNLFQSQPQQQQQQQQIEQQIRDSPDDNNQGQSGGGGYNANGNSSLNISNEIKRLQQLHQLSSGGGNPSLLMNSGSSSHDPATTAFLQSMLAADSQQKANLNANNNRFENQLTGNAMISSNANNNTVPAPSSSGNAPANSSMPMQLPSNFLNDARLLMAQNQLYQQNQGMPFAMMPQQQQQQQQQPALGTNLDIPLPSPHSLFHRDGSRRMRGGVIEPFPEKLHRLLTEVEAAGRSDVISFVASGRAFAIHKPDKFFKEIVPLYFRQSRLSSFKRQLNLYGFELINTGPARGGYYHELFVKDRPELCRRMRRVAVKVGSDAKKGKSDDPTIGKPSGGDHIVKKEDETREGGKPNEQQDQQQQLQQQQQGGFQGDA